MADKGTEEKAPEKPKAASSKKAPPIDKDPVPFAYFLRFVDRKNHNKLGVCYGYLAELKKKGEEQKTKKKMKEWNEIIEKLIQGMGK